MHEKYAAILKSVASSVHIFTTSRKTQSLKNHSDFAVLLNFTANIALYIDQLTKMICDDLRAETRIDDIEGISASLKREQEKFMQHVQHMIESAGSNPSGSIKVLVTSFVSLGNNIMHIVGLLASLTYENDKSNLLHDLHQRAAEVTSVVEEIRRSGHDYAMGLPAIQSTSTVQDAAGARPDAVTIFNSSREIILAGGTRGNVEKDGGFLSLATASLRGLMYVNGALDNLSDVLTRFKANNAEAGYLLAIVVGQAKNIRMQTYQVITRALLQKAHISAQISGHFEELDALIKDFKKKAIEAIRAVPRVEAEVQHKALDAALEQLDELIALCQQLNAEENLLLTGGKDAAPGPLRRLVGAR